MLLGGRGAPFLENLFFCLPIQGSKKHIPMFLYSKIHLQFFFWLIHCVFVGDMFDSYVFWVVPLPSKSGK